MATTIEQEAPPAQSGERPTPPGPKGVPVLGTIPEIRRKGLIRFYVDAWREYGDVIYTKTGPLDQLLLVKPEHVKYVLSDNRQNYEKGIGMRKVRLVLGEGLFTSERDLWRRQRHLMQGPFTPRSVVQFAPVMIDATRRLMAGWKKRTANGEALDINKEMMHLAMSIIMRTMFHMEINKEAARAARAFTHVLNYLSTTSITLVDVPMSVPTPRNRRFKRSMQIIDSFIYSVINERRTLGDDQPNDLLGTLIKARDPETGEPMSNRQIRDEVVTIFFAGHETTAQALTWTWYLLSEHPDVEAKVHEEVDRVFEGRVPEGEDAEKLTYIEMVVNEAMRLYPPVWIFVRQALNDDEIGGYHVPAGAMIVLSQYITHRHPDYWENPEEFDPERWTPERSEGRHRYAYYPFGGGPRICLGNNFALLEAVLAVATISQRYKLRLVPGQHIEPKMLGTLRPNGPVRMTIEPR